MDLVVIHKYVSSTDARIYLHEFWLPRRKERQRLLWWWWWVQKSGKKSNPVVYYHNKLFKRIKVYL